MAKHASEQQKYQQFLSPEDKAQILNKDAAAHKQQRKFLPPEDKN
jgi:hypothetical protein